MIHPVIFPDYCPVMRVDGVPFLNKLHTFKQLSDLRYKGYDIFVNLCEGYLDWDIPSIDVIYAMETLKLPFTGAERADCMILPKS